MKRKNFCLYPFAAFSLDNQGKQRICCNNDGWNEVQKNKNFSDSSFNVLENFNNKFHKSVRKFIIEDKRHPSCKKCWEIEDQGKVSWRQWFNESFETTVDEEYWISKCDSNGIIKDTEFLYLDITFGNRCNLKCVMCNGYNSTLFLKEQLDTKEISLKEFDRLIKLDWFEDGKCFEKLYGHIKHVQRIHILGGEPLILEHQEFLKKFIELGVSKNIILSYNSNLTKVPREILECWKEFKRVYLCVSVDAYKELNEFIRFPMKWDKLISNLELVDEIAKEQGNISIQIHATFSSLNSLYITEFLDWTNDISKRLTSIEPYPMFNYVYKPEWFDPVHLPSKAKNESLRKFKEWEKNNSEYLLQREDNGRLDMLRSYLEKITNSSGNPKMWKQCLEKINFFEKHRNITYSFKEEF